MAKVTSKLQLTVPKAIAERHGLKPGMEVDFESAGETVRIRIRQEASDPRQVEWRLHGFDDATQRQLVRNERLRAELGDLCDVGERGWTREELYDRGLAR